MYQLSRESRGGLTPSLSPTRQIGNYGNGWPLPLAFPKLKLCEVHYEAHIAALEDKIVQKAAVAVLNCIYEVEFLGFSYGFRPKRGQHDALDALVVGISERRVNFIYDADVATFLNRVSYCPLVYAVQSNSFI